MMAEIFVSTGEIRTQGEQLQGVIECLVKAESELCDVDRKISEHLLSESYFEIRKRISSLSAQIEKNKGNIQTLKSVLDSSRELYQRTENEAEAFFENKLGEVDRGVILGIGLSVFGTEFSGKILDASVKNSGKIEKDMEGGNIKFEYQTRNDITGLSIDGKSKFGMYEGETQIDMLTGSVKGEVYASLFDEGKFSPGIGVAGSIGGSLFSVKHESRVGNEDVNAYVKGEGKVLAAEVSGEVGAGKIKGKDGDYVFGVSAKGEAGAYLAKGEVKGGFELFGIKIEASAKGSIGLGVEGSAGITSDGAELGIGAAILGGGSVEVNVDWSGLKENLKKKFSNWF